MFSSLDEVEIKFTKERNKESQFSSLNDVVYLVITVNLEHELRQQIDKIRSNVFHFKRTLKDGKTGSSCKSVK